MSQAQWVKSWKDALFLPLLFFVPHLELFPPVPVSNLAGIPQPFWPHPGINEWLHF